MGFSFSFQLSSKSFNNKIFMNTLKIGFVDFFLGGVIETVNVDQPKSHIVFR